MRAIQYPVGVFLQEEMDARGWSDEDVAARMGETSEKGRVVDALTVMAIRQCALINGEECEIGEAFAHKLAAAFDVSADFFLNIEAAYRSWQKRHAKVD